ncbi:MAG TPA: hypothetical protein VKU19_17820 [Bryobacteraceae bacterium]|nr:hypothetical protein [Bryobacteraceae bacterium]
MGLLFGFRRGSLPELAAQIEAAAGVRFALHDSLFHGGDYYRFESDGEQLILQRNNDGGGPDEPAEESFAEFPFLLYVNSSLPSEKWALCLSAEPLSAVLLRSEN